MLKSECKVIMSPHQNTLGLTNLLVFVLACLNTDVGFALQLQGSQTSHSSTSGDNLAGLAVDNDIQTTSITNEEANPWWKVDLGNTYCLKKITLFTRPSDEGAVVRAGLSPNHLQNRMIGSPLTQAQSGQSTDFTLDPTVIARYVSVDIPTGSGEMKSLVLGEVEVDEIIQSEDYTTSSALPLLGNPSRQSSQHDIFDSSRALDGNLHFPSCTFTAVGELNPWWKVDLVTEYCVGKIRIFNRAGGFEYTRQRLVGAVVRAGPSDVPFNNAACGSPVTSQQANSGNWIEFTCDPPRQSRYVSVDLPSSEITLCEVQVLTCKEMDFTLVTNIPVIGETGDNEAAITAYKGCSDLTASVSFGRQLTTGGTNTGLPTGFNEVDDSILGRAARSLILPDAGGIDRVGVFYSEVTKSGRSSRIQTILLPKDDSDVNILPEQRTLTVNAGESVNLTMVPHNSQTNVNIRWKHNEDAMNGWNNQLTVSIPSVVQSDEGIYSCFVDGQEHQQRHGIMRLIVRACPSGMWGPVCSNTCRRCYNGGICDDQTGTCVCAPGFSGPNCEKVHGRHVFGKDAQYSCSDSHDPHHAACQGHLFCLPDPYGCSCAAGNMGLGCMQECPEEMYGADCKQTCHCQGDGTCLKDTGKCMEGVGCQSPYFGHNCQCTGMITDTVILQFARSDRPSEITLQWDAVCADEYRVEYLQLNKEGCQAIDPSSASINTHCSCQSTSTTIPDLDSNSLYRVTVQARFGLSYSPAATREVMTGTSEPKASPTDVQSSTKTDTSLSFSWSEPPCGGRGGIITGYTYKLTQVGSMPDIVVDQTSTSSTMVTIPGLIPYTDYSFQVAASTSAGTGPFSNGIIERTLEGVPPAPADFKVRSANESSITVEWTEPDPPRGIIINYDISYWSSMQSEASATILEDVGMTSLSYQIEGLMTNVNYIIKVRAKTSAGTGVWSVAVHRTTQIGVPGPVENLRSTNQTEKSVTLEWNPPLNPNGQIMKYIVEYRAVEKVHVVDFTADIAYTRMELGNELRATITNLEPTTKYELKISAQNQRFTGNAAVLEVFTKPLENLPSPQAPRPNPNDAADTTVLINLSRVPDDDYITSYVIHVKKTASKTKREALDPIHYGDSHDNYIAAELSKQMVPDYFVVGDGGMYGGYYNAPLDTGASYAIRVGSVSRGNGTYATVTYSEPITVKVLSAATGNPLVAPVIIFGLIVLIVVPVLIIVCLKWRKDRSDVLAASSKPIEGMDLNQHVTSNQSSSVGHVHDDKDIYEDIGLPQWAIGWNIQWKHLTVEDTILGKGHFGEVRLGEIKMKGKVTKAAIKLLKGGSPKNAAEDFLKEFQTMTLIKPHPNVVGLLGACFNEGTLYVALEFVPGDNLRNYLRKNRPIQLQQEQSKYKESPVTMSQLLKFGVYVTKGMQHLSDAGIIHRDLAARNILLGEELIAKVSDFGLSRGEDVYVQESKTRIPVRWLAIESLTHRRYVSKSDVWSFGILLWEIVTFGGTPYPGIQTRELADKLLDGYRMPQPEHCPDDIYALMLKCWMKPSNKRPSFKEITQVLDKIRNAPVDNAYMLPAVYENFSVIKPEFDNN